MNIILFDTEVRDHLLPFTFTRPVSEIRVGIRTIREKWEAVLAGSFSWKTEDYLSGKFPMATGSENLVINAAVCPNAKLVEAVDDLRIGQQLKAGDLVLAQRVVGEFENWQEAEVVEFDGEFNYIDRPWKIFSLNGAELEYDFEEITKGRTSQKLSSTNTILGNRIFVEEGVEAECVVFNTTTGPIYLGKNSSVLEGSLIRGGLALCEHSQIKLGAKIYGPTTVGPHSKVGGEATR